MFASWTHFCNESNCKQKLYIVCFPRVSLFNIIMPWVGEHFSIPSDAKEYVTGNEHICRRFPLFTTIRALMSQHKYLLTCTQQTLTNKSAEAGSVRHFTSIRRNADCSRYPHSMPKLRVIKKSLSRQVRCKPRMWNLFTTTGRMDCGISLASREN